MPSGIRTDLEILDLLILDLLAEGASPPEAAAMVDRDVAWGRYESCGQRAGDGVADDYQAQAERVLARAERMAEGLFRVNARGGGDERPRAAAMRGSHGSRRVSGRSSSRRRPISMRRRRCLLKPSSRDRARTRRCVSRSGTFDVRPGGQDPSGPPESQGDWGPVPLTRRTSFLVPGYAETSACAEPQAREDATGAAHEPYH